MARKLIEGATDQIIAYLKANLPAAISSVSALYSDGIDLSPVAQWMIYPKVQGFDLPVVFVIADDQDFNIQKNSANFIAATDHFKISIVVDEVDEERLTRRAYRYQSALHSVLDGATMVSSDNLLVLKSVVYRASFSDVWQAKESESGGKFRKEVVLECNIEHFENV